MNGGARFSLIMKRLFLLFSLLVFGFVAGIEADQAVSAYTGATGSGKSVSRGCTFILFDMTAFTGSIGNATFSNVTRQFPVYALHQGDVLSAVPYAVTSGTLVILEVR